MKPDVLVLGAGMIGTCTALQLALRGHSVALVDRREPGRETSYGNAGLIQCEAVEPYPFPQDPAMLLRVAFKRGADVNYHLSAMPSLSAPLGQYWANSRGQRYQQIAREYGQLSSRSVTEHAPLIEMAGANDLVRRDGYRMVFRTQARLDEAVVDAERLQREVGVNFRAMTGEQLATAEPALKQRLVGAVHWTDPWSVADPGELVQRYADLLVQRGGSIVQGDAMSLRASGAGWQVQTEHGPVEAARAVVALGPWSDRLIRQLGYRLPLFVKRGYHRHYLGGRGPDLAMFDSERGYVMVPMKRGVRLTTGAEFAHLDAPSTPVQIARAEVLARELIDLPDPVEAEPWRGARPCTGDLKPVIGPAPRHPGLWFHFGHGHQGFTMGAVSARLLAEQMAGEACLIDPTPYLPQRFL
ncbi:NAD(P)/FAD-dependent oxidoreductase [Hydrogenophaga palleronii]|uniref:NAD(P)/FAD-dependent oxidoreductase n=1 Tax=Hydrogenophaga palleronii TaxID=65655 RepID=UPI0008267FC4|nr:FAD-dependent oxidoreductase [Hydrogenophaga palleronii]